MTLRSERKEAGSFVKFRLLMWKNFLQQWRHRVQTVVELFVPVFTMMLVLILRWQISPIEMDTFTYPPIPASSLESSLRVIGGMDYANLSIAYSPRSDKLDDVVRSAVANLLLKNSMQILPIFVNISELPIEIGPDFDITQIPNIFEIVKALIPVNAYNNSDELRSIYLREEITRKVIAAVEFDDDLLETTELPATINYALRFPERPRLNSLYMQGASSWRTELVFPVFEIIGPRFPYSYIGGNDPGYVTEMFIALQHAISSELITRLTGMEVDDFGINLQRYPHPPYVMDLAVEVLQYLLPMFFMLSFSYTAVNIVRAVTVEKELQLKETMKIMGLPTWLHWTAWFCKQFIFLFITSVLIVIILKVNWFTSESGFSDYSVFTNTPWTVLFFFILLYVACTIFFCFMLSGFFSKGSTAALFAGVIWFLSSMPAFLLTLEADMSIAMQTFTCLSINSAMHYGFQIMLAKESTGGLQWGEFLSSPSTETSRFTFGHVVIMLSIDCVLYMLIALYFEQVLPGKYGTPQPWYFIFKKNFWFPNRNKDNGVILSNNDSENILREKEPTGHAIGVKMQNLTKTYGSHTAVNNLSLNIFDDQITVLLGHNGAGKSTTISMLTGNLELTAGSIVVAGYDMKEQAPKARSHIGLCPQHNVLFNELTVKEHLEFFARLKGFQGNDLKEEINVLIEKLQLQDKRDYQSQGLSGGQKRRLCVGVALSGAASVVLLDEPTSGMDPASRRALWELLQREKKGRSMILTTHFMDEADILGDRVAIMAQGRLQCIGSPNFLKQNHGVGYALVIVKDNGFSYEACNDLINKYIPGATIDEDRGSEIKYTLLNSQSHIFEVMLDDLEKNYDKIKFVNYGLTATTLEDVFLSLGADLAPVNSVSDDGATTTGSTCDDILRNDFTSLDQLHHDNDSIKGFKLFCHHVIAIWIKLALVWTRSWGLIILQLLVPVILINTTLFIFEYVLSFVDSVTARHLSLTEGFERTETFLSYNGTSSTVLGALAKTAYEVMFQNSDIDSMQLTTVDESIEEYYLKRADTPTTMGQLRHSVLIGATFDENSATAWFSNFGYHDIAISLAAVQSALLKAVNSTAQLNVYNHPLEANYADQNNMQVMLTMLSMQLANGIGTSVAIISAVYVMFYIRERASGAKLLQKAAGLQPAVLWGSSALFDWAWFIIVCLTILVSCAAFQVLGLSSPAELGRLYVCLIVYGAAMLPLNYLFTLMFKGPALGFVVMFFVNILFGMMGAQIVEALLTPQLETEDAAHILDSILQFFPMYSLITAIRLLNQIEMTTHTCMQACEYMSVTMPNINDCTLEFLCQNYSDSCCIRENAQFDWEEPGILRYLVNMVASCVVLWILLMLVEYRIFQRIFTLKKTPPPLDVNTLDPDVADEMRHAKHVAQSSLATHGLITRDLSKYYGKHLAVNQVSFTVNDRECFGLLGVNGAGKTSTFKMLMGDESISNGDAFVSGYSVQNQLTKVHANIGYCPQFDALFGELTGRETLKIFSLLRGLPLEQADLQAEALAQSLGFIDHFDKRVDQYSGGTKRKLNTAVAFLGKTRLVFIDEPTTGVDPAAKRHVWRATRNVQKSGRGVVLTSHSMEECEALCSRLTIMVNGQFQCLGTPQHLKNKFSQGFTLTIKLKVDDQINSTTGTMKTNAVKHYINDNFVNPKIMEEYQGLLTYYLSDCSMLWSKMFGIMERAKRDLDVEHYSISQTTLEQIFLQFTKYQWEGL